jgi:hypothetical protein
MSLIVLGIKVKSNMPGVVLSRGAGRQWLNDRWRETMLDVANEWYRKIFPKHFTRGAPAEYDYEPRSDFYLSVVKRFKGEGAGKQKGLLEYLTGRSARQMKSFADVSGTARKATVKMHAPAYFTRPFIGTIPGRGKRKPRRITRQPNKPDEVTRTSDADKQKLREFGAAFLAKRMRKLPPPITKQIT